jgi:glycosyltransferase involved in cell wall biosynthesis
MISVVIPAHNEETVIGRCLAGLLDGAREGELEVIVVCNGCSDGTADAARAVGAAVGGVASAALSILETPVASKVHALNLGDEHASGFPRFYIDADVVLPLGSLRKLAQVLSNGAFLAVAPRFRMNSGAASWFVRAFYSVNDLMPSSREGIGGSGVYGLSQQGRARFDRFPELTADDGFVRLQFSPSQRVTVEDCFSRVTAPRTLWELIRIKTRSHYGNMELKLQIPQLWISNRGQSNGGALKRLAMRPAWWGKLSVYLLVKSAARWRAWRWFSRREVVAWERDESSRAAVREPSAPVVLAGAAEHV